VIAARFLALAILYFVCFIVVSGALLSTAPEQSARAEASTTLLRLFVVSLINTAVWTYIILRSRWAGWKLVLAVFIVFYGVSTVMSQIETAYFITRLPPGMLPRLFLAGAIMAAVFAPLAVLILGKFTSQASETSKHSRLEMSVGVWIAKLSLIVVAYLLIYFTFGYFIAWRNAALRDYYGGTDSGSFIAHIASLLRNEPLLFLLQAVRALLWTTLAVPIIKMLKGEWWESGLAVALLFGVFMNSVLLLPNPLMPAEVRMVHLVETATSNFLFGWLIVMILRAKPLIRTVSIKEAE
jgi:fumarate reductase subunit D